MSSDHRIEPVADVIVGYVGWDAGQPMRGQASELLAAADEADRAAGWVRLRTDDPELIDRLARLLDEQDMAGGGSRWDDDPPPGWQSQQALRAAYRDMAREVLAVLSTPPHGSDET